MDFWQNYGLGFLTVAVVVALVARIIWNQKRKLPKGVTQEEQAKLDYELVPKCVCGAVATRPAPILRRTRGAYDFLRNYFAVAPRYKRVIDLMQAPEYCEQHAHTADAKLDQFIFAVRSKYAALNAEISAEAAAFEQESLRNYVAESLTDLQKKFLRKPVSTTLRVLPPKTGTDDTTSEG
jgi:hypothetical protein